jgi:hypothetical protein
MKMKKLFFIAFAAVVAFTSCKKENTIDLLSSDPGSKTLAAGESFVLTAKPMPDNVEVDFTFTSSHPTIASVEKTDKRTATVTALAAGSATITIEGGGKTKDVKVTVSAGPDMGETRTSYAEDFEGFTEGTGAAYMSTQSNNKGWLEYSIQGELRADVRTYNENKYVQFSAHRNSITTQTVQEFWLMSPRLDVSTASAKTLSFDLAQGYTNAATEFKVYVIKGDNTSAERVELTGFNMPPATASGYSAFVNSGSIDLSAYTGVIRIGFYYKGTSGSGNSTTYQLDNFIFGGGSIASLNVSPTALSFGKEGGAKTITVTTTEASFTAVSSDPANFSVSTSDNVITVTAAANSAETTRTATVTVTAGTLEKIVNISQAGDVESGANLLANGSFEDFTADVPTGWNIGTDPNNAPVEKVSSNAHDGDIAVKMAGTAAGRCDLVQTVSGIIPGKTYIVSFWYRNNTKTAGSSGIRLWSNFTNAGAYINPTGTSYEAALRPGATLEAVQEWTEYRVEVTAPNDVDGFRFEIRATKNTNGVVDNCSIVEKE